MSHPHVSNRKNMRFDTWCTRGGRGQPACALPLLSLERGRAWSVAGRACSRACGGSPRSPPAGGGARWKLTPASDNASCCRCACACACAARDATSARGARRVSRSGGSAPRGAYPACSLLVCALDTQNRLGNDARRASCAWRPRRAQGRLAPRARLSGLAAVCAIRLFLTLALTIAAGTHAPRRLRRLGGRSAQGADSRPCRAFSAALRG